MKKLIILITIFYISLEISAQVFLGMTANQIKDTMKLAYPNFSLVKGAKGAKNYIKFVDWDGDQTWLFMIVDDKCLLSKFILDKSMWRQRKRFLNQEGFRLNKNTWIIDDYIMRVNMQKWFLIITTKKKHPAFKPRQKFIYKFKIIWYLT